MRNLRDEDKLSYLIQGLRSDIQADVLKKEPKTYAEAEDAARLIYSIQQSLTQRREEDISPIVQNANRVSPTTTELETNRIARTESDLRSVINRLDSQSQVNPALSQNVLENKVAAFQPTLKQAPEAEQLMSLQQQVRQLSRMISGTQSLSAYQPTARENYHQNSAKDDEIIRMKEEICQLKAMLRTSQPQRGVSPETYPSARPPTDITADFSRALEEMRRMQSRMDGFMRAYATRSYRQDQPRVRTRDGWPMCDICGRVGHVRLNCYHRFQQQPNCYQPPTIPYNSNLQENEPRIASFEQAVPLQNQPTVNDQKKPHEQVERVFYARRSQPIQPTPASTEVPTISTIETDSSSTEKEEIEEHPNIEVTKAPEVTSTQRVEDTSVRIHQPTDQHEIVVRIEVCAANNVMPSDRINPTVIPSMNEQNPEKDGWTPPGSTKSTLDIHPKGKVEATPAETLDPLKKQARKETLVPSTNNARLCPKREQSNAFITAAILGCPVDLLVDSRACVSVIDATFLQEAFSEDTTPIIVPILIQE